MQFRVTDTKALARSVGRVLLVAACLLPAACAPAPSRPSLEPTSAPADATITVLAVGSASINFAPIDGWCLYPPARMVQSIHDSAEVAPDLVYHSYFGDCGQIQAAEALDGWVVDFGSLATPKELVDTDLGDDRSGFVKAMAAQLQRANANEAVSAAQARAIDMFNARNSDLSFSETTNLGVVDQDRDAVYFALIQKGSVEGIARAGSVSRLTVGAATLLRGRMILLYLSSDYEPGHSLDIVLARTKAQVQRLIRLNPTEIGS